MVKKSKVPVSQIANAEVNSGNRKAALTRIKLRYNYKALFKLCLVGPELQI